MTTWQQKQEVTGQLRNEYNKKIDCLTFSGSAQYKVYTKILHELILGEDAACRMVEQELKTETNKHARKAYLAFIVRRNTLMPLLGGYDG
jgi:hypothetical protein